MAGFQKAGPVCGTKDGFDLQTLTQNQMPIPGPVCFSRVKEATSKMIDEGNHTASKKQTKYRYSAPRKPNARIMQTINDELGTKINFNKLADFEGGQLLDAEIPGHTLGSKERTVEGNSGVSIATGFDMGQRTVAEIIADFGFSQGLVRKYAKFCSLTKRRAIEALEQSGGLHIEQYEADETDYKVQRFHLMAAIDSWDEPPEPATKFRNLTMAQQTVILSRTYHQGIEMPDTAIADGFYSAAQSGHWVKAETELRNYAVGKQEDWYRIRVCSEANYLAEERQKQQELDAWLDQQYAKGAIP